ncbi:MAG: hypothetical protein SGJ24_12890 [Chloroflexota bacterium]|nr:hypothetical protein [Chloroflexota bacterium]
MAQNEVRQRATGAVLVNALLRWESILTIVLSIVLFLAFPFPFPWWQPFFWLIGGAIAEGALLVTALSDPEAAAQAIAREFEAKFDLRAVKSAVSRERLERAVEYRRSMMKLVGQSSGAMRVQLQETVNDVSDWIAHMYNLALHVDGFESNRLVDEDRRAVPQQLEKVKVRLAREADAAVRQDLQEQMDKLQLQLTNLNATANSVKRAEIQLDSTLSSLGTIYAQMSRLGTKDVDSSRAQRLRLEIQDEVAGLQDTIEAMNEVQAQSLQLS